MINVTIEDYFKDRRIDWLYGEHNMTLIDEMWEIDDKLLIGISHTEFFKGLTKWSQLQPVHYEFLLINNIKVVDGLTEDEFNDDNNPAIKSVFFLVGCMIKSISSFSGFDVETLKIRRITEMRIDIDHTATTSFDMELMITRLKNKDIEEPLNHGLKIVVDNTVPEP